MIIKVYIFEDHWMCREALVSVLNKEAGIEVVGDTDHVPSGMEQVLELKPDVILMDIRFHNENLGIEATATLTQKLKETKIIIFTEFQDEQNLRAAIKAGASGFLLKKEVQDSNTIVKAITTVYKGEAYITPSVTAKIFNEVKRKSDRQVFDLTKRELQILKLISEGKNNKDIAAVLNIDKRTVANHISNILFKMNAKNRTEAAAIGRREGIIT